MLIIPDHQTNCGLYTSEKIRNIRNITEFSKVVSKMFFIINKEVIKT